MFLPSPVVLGSVIHRAGKNDIRLVLVGRSKFSSSSSVVPMFKEIEHERQPKLSVTHPSPRGKGKYVFQFFHSHKIHLLTLIPSISQTTPTISEDGSADDGVTVHCDSPAVANGGTVVSPTARKS